MLMVKGSFVWVRTEQTDHLVLLIYEVLLMVSTGYFDTISVLVLCLPVQWHPPPKRHLTCMRFSFLPYCSRWLQQRPEGNYPARSLHHGVQEKRSNFSLHYCYKATRLKNWWKTFVSCFLLFPCRPSCIWEFCFLPCPQAGQRLDNVYYILGR